MEGDVTFTERELDVMSVLWAEGSGTVRDVQARFPDDTGYTTVLKFLQILERKGHVRHEREGRSYRYFPTVPAEAAGRSALGRIVDKVFHGAADLALARLVEERPLTAEEIDRMRRILDELEPQPRSDEGGEGGGGDPR